MQKTVQPTSGHPISSASYLDEMAFDGTAKSLQRGALSLWAVRIIRAGVSAMPLSLPETGASGCNTPRPISAHALPQEGSSRELKSEAEAEIVVAGRQRPEVADRYAAVQRAVVPRAAAKHAVRATRAIHPGLPIRRCAGVVAVPVVLTPLPYVAAHIVQTQLVGALLAHGMRLTL